MNSEVEQLRDELAQVEERVTELENRLGDTGTPEAVEGLREFVETHGPSSHTERSLSIAYFLEAYRDKEQFTVNDIEEGYRECRVQVADNMSDVLGRMEDQDWLLRDGKEGQTQLWRLSAPGQGKIEEEVSNGT